MTLNKISQTLALGMVLGLLAGPPAVADWLVTREGDRIETRGAWEVRGKLVVFTLPNGTLSSIRIADVDLEASRELAERRARAAEERPSEPTPRERPEPVLVLTDADVRTYRTPPQAPPGEEAPDAENDEEGPPTDGLQVSTWRTVGDDIGDGIEIEGILRNTSRHLAAGILLTVAIYDDEGELLQQVDARPSATSLRPGQTTPFRAQVPGVRTYASILFEAEARWLRVEPGGEDAPLPQ